MYKSLYVPADNNIYSKSPWTPVKINLSYMEITEKKIVLWCNENILGLWTMMGTNKFLFEDSGDALRFTLQFGV